MIEYQHCVHNVYFPVSVGITVNDVGGIFCVVSENVCREIFGIRNIRPIFYNVFAVIRHVAVVVNVILNFFVFRFCSVAIVFPIREPVIHQEHAHSEFGSDFRNEERRQIAFSLNLHLSCFPREEYFKRVTVYVCAHVCVKEFALILILFNY